MPFAECLSPITLDVEPTRCASRAATAQPRSSSDQRAHRTHRRDPYRRDTRLLRSRAARRVRGGMGEPSCPPAPRALSRQRARPPRTRGAQRGRAGLNWIAGLRRITLGGLPTSARRECERPHLHRVHARRGRRSIASPEWRETTASPKRKRAYGCGLPTLVRVVLRTRERLGRGHARIQRGKGSEHHSLRSAVRAARLRSR
jgi:hypothetical protein